MQFTQIVLFRSFNFLNCEHLKRRLYISLCNFYNFYNNYVCCNILEGFHITIKF